MKFTCTKLLSAACACLIGLSGAGLTLAGPERACTTKVECRSYECSAYKHSRNRCVTSRPCHGSHRPGCSTTARPTCVVTSRPTANPTAEPTSKPTVKPTAKPTSSPTVKPTAKPTSKPTVKPTAKPTSKPTAEPTSPGGSGSADYSMARQVLDMVNEERAAAGLSTLEMSDSLTRAAQIRADEITRSFSHTRPDGSSFSTVTSGAYGENIAKGQSSAARVMAAWMSSSGHRANILNSRYATIGICAYEYNGVMYWVQLFGK